MNYKTRSLIVEGLSIETSFDKDNPHREIIFSNNEVVVDDFGNEKVNIIESFVTFLDVQDIEDLAILFAELAREMKI